MQNSRFPAAPAISRIAVVRALQLGDLLCAVPAVRALRAAFPQAEITLVGQPWSRSFVERFSSYFDDLLEFPGFPGLPEQPVQLKKLPDFFATAQAKQFDLALQMHGSGQITNSLTLLLGARLNAGFFLPGQYCPAPEYFMPYPDNEPEPRRYLRLMEFLGISLQGDHAEFPLHEEDFQELQELNQLAVLEKAGGLLPETYVCIHPGARYPSRRWLPERFAAVADSLAGRGFSVVLTGSREEASLTGAVAAAMHARCLDLAGRTSLGGLAALLSRARLVISNDTGISHVVAGLRVPSVIVASGSDVQRWAPLDGELHRVLWQNIDCRPCMHFECPIGHPCAAAVQVEDVLREVDTLLHSRVNGLAAPVGSGSGSIARGVSAGSPLR